MEARVLGAPERPVPLPLGLRWMRRLNFPRKLGICERLYGGALTNNGVSWVRTAAGPVWKLDLRNPTHRWIVYGHYEGPSFFAWARRHLRADAVFVDSGANIGQMIVNLAALMPDGRIVAFEPGRAAAAWLRECLTVTNLPVEVFPMALGASAGTAFLRDGAAESIHGAQSQISDSEGEPISIVALADFVARSGIPRIDLWKLDVEGYEIPALQGAAPLLRSGHIGAIYAELTGGNGERISRYLSEFGYRCYLLDAAGRARPATHLPGHTNGLFLPLQ